MKRCTQCNTAKPFGDFQRRAASKDGLQPRCKECVAAYCRDRRKAHIDRIRAVERAYYEEHKEELKVRRADYFQQYAQEHLPEAAERQRRYRKKNKERVYASLKKYRAANPDKVRRWSRKAARRQREKLGAVYVRMLICDGSPLTHADIPQEMVETKRAQLQLRRWLRDNEGSNNNEGTPRTGA